MNMRLKWLNRFVILSLAIGLAPSVSAEPPERGDRESVQEDRGRGDRGRGDRERGGPERGERERGGPERGERERGERERGGPGAMDPGRMMRMLPLFAALDADRDGTISREEIENASKALKKLDKNDDGKLDMSELRPDFAGRPGPPPRDGARGPRDGERGPRDGERGPRDGERGPRDGERGPRDGERGPGASERGPRGNGPRDGAPMVERLMQLDKNEDGELSKDELSELPEGGERLMRVADRNNDGALSKDELNAFRQRVEGMRRNRDRE